MNSRVSWLLPLLTATALLTLACQSRPAGAPSAAGAAPAAAPAQPAAGAQVPAQPAAQPAFDERTVANFYRGKTIRFVVGYPPGGGFDTYARAIARHLGKYIPGTPGVIVDNMPGGGSLIAANYVYGASRPDGLTIGHWNGRMILQQVLGGEGIEFDARKYRFIGVPTPDNPVCAVRREAGFRTLSEAVNAPRQLILGGTAPGTVLDDGARLLSSTLGLNIKLVSGYGGTALIRQAADGGEVHGGCWAWESVKVTWKAALESGDAIVIGQLTAQKLPDFPDVEVALDLARTDEARQLLRTGMILPSALTRPFAVHPGTPEDRLQALRQAFMAVFQDPEFQEEAQRAKLDVDPIDGDQAEKLVRELFDIPEATKEKLKTILVVS
jgi:tripartite-type tricarboxylate transporter receptor subunit TctC